MQRRSLPQKASGATKFQVCNDPQNSTEIYHKEEDSTQSKIKHCVMEADCLKYELQKMIEGRPPGRVASSGGARDLIKHQNNNQCKMI